MIRKWSVRLKEQVNALGTTIFLAGVLVGLGAYLVLREAFDNGAIGATSMELKDWTATWLAALAFLFSLLAFFHNRHQAKQDAFLAIHEKMIAFDIQEGRRFLRKIESVEDVKALATKSIDDFQKVNRALAMYDVLGMYVTRKYVYKSVVLEEWGRNLAKARQPALYFGEYRKKRWDHFDALSNDAAAKYPKAVVEGVPETK